MWGPAKVCCSSGAGRGGPGSQVHESRQACVARQRVHGFEETLDPLETTFPLGRDECVLVPRPRLPPAAGDRGDRLGHVTPLTDREASVGQQALVMARGSEEKV